MDNKNNKEEPACQRLGAASCSTMKLNCDTTQFTDALDTLKSHITQIPQEVLVLLRGGGDGIKKLFRFESAPAPVGASVTISLKPTDFLLDALATLRASDL